MPSVLDTLDAADALPETVGNKLDAADVASPKEGEYIPKAEATPWYERAAKGLADPVVGVGQLEQHLMPDSWANFLRKYPGFGPPGVGLALQAASGGRSDLSTAQVDQDIAQNESEYQAGRKAAGSEGLDWWRIGGNVGNPLNWAGGGASAATATGRVMQSAAQGGLTALMQPVTRPGSFTQDKLVQGGTGAVVGGAIGGALELISKPLAAVVNKARSLFGTDAAQNASQVVDDVLKENGVDPAKVDPRVLSSIRQETHEATNLGVAPDPKVMANRADAASLPVPVNLTRGQAARDPLQFAWEQNHRSLAPAITDRLAEQNRQLIENLNQLGGEKAISPYAAGENITTALNKLDDGLKGEINQAYSAVRNAAGRPASMDYVTFVKTANDALDQGQLGAYLPPTVLKQLNDISEGKLPLNVNVAQQLDRVWSAEQRSAQGSAKAAIGTLRDALNDAPVADSLGQQAMQAYKAARQMAKQRFDLIDNVPAYKAAIEGEAPDQFFQKYVLGSPAKSVDAMKGLLDRVDPTISPQMQSTVVGMLKSKALNGAADENGVFSQAAYNKFLNDPVRRARIEAVFKDSPEILGQLDRVGRVAENVQKFPAASAVNTSNTAAAKTIMEKEPGMIAKTVDAMLPKGVSMAREAVKNRAARKAVESALNPGVTTAAAPAMSAGQREAAKTLGQLLIPPASVGALQSSQ